MAAPPFRDGEWDLDKLATSVLGELVQQAPAPGGKAWNALLDPAVDGYDAAGTPAELEELRALIEYRAAVFEEALAQRAGLLTYMRGVLNFSQASHPATYRLCVVAFKYAEFQDMYWKRVFRRPRPSRMDPALVPPIEVPGHAAFPSGHACEAMMIALVLEQALPAAIIPVDGAEAGPLRLMARRIARNREVLGLHYPSDTRCGFKIAARSLPLFLSSPFVQGTAAQPAAAQVRAHEGLSLGAGFAAEPLPAAGDLHPDGLLARARAEWE